MVTLKPQKGHLLIAEPSILTDTIFNRSVILLADYSVEGSVGFILNKPLEYTLKDLIPGTALDNKIYNGGPVEQDNLYFIHKVPDLIPNSVEISLGIYWGGDFDMAISLLASDKINECDIRFFLGYSGWEAEQLEFELEQNSWIITTNDYKHQVISKTDDCFWKEQMLELGGEYCIWSNAPECPSYN